MNTIITEVVNSKLITDAEKVIILADIAVSLSSKITLLENKINKQNSDHAWEVAGHYGNQGGA